VKQITTKQKGFANKLLTNPKASATQAAADVYAVKNRHVAEQIAYENMRKPEILRYMGKYADMAEKRIIELMQSSDERVAFNASKDVLDRRYGKATQRSEVSARTVELNIDLTGGG
jgi:phage terminase small subunit